MNYAYILHTHNLPITTSLDTYKNMGPRTVLVLKMTIQKEESWESCITILILRRNQSRDANDVSWNGFDYNHWLVKKLDAKGKGDVDN